MRRIGDYKWEPTANCCVFFQLLTLLLSNTLIYSNSCLVFRNKGASSSGDTTHGYVCKATKRLVLVDYPGSDCMLLKKKKSRQDGLFAVNEVRERG